MELVFHTPGPRLARPPQLKCRYRREREREKKKMQMDVHLVALMWSLICDSLTPGLQHTPTMANHQPATSLATAFHQAFRLTVPVLPRMLCVPA